MGPTAGSCVARSVGMLGFAAFWGAGPDSRLKIEPEAAQGSSPAASPAHASNRIGQHDAG